MQSFDPSVFVREPQEHKICDETGKRSYRSKSHARAAHRGASFRLRAYICDCCGNYHVTNEDKYKD